MDDMGFGMATFVQFLAISIMQLLLYCWYGNELTYQVNDSIGYYIANIRNNNKRYKLAVIITERFVN
jgi:hypothetical protein